MTRSARHQGLKGPVYGDSQQSSTSAVPPILFLVFNRPQQTLAVHQAIRAARPKRLYVAADGPRDGHSDPILCANVRSIATSVDWPCEVFTLLREKNLGCRDAVAQGIDWFFSHEESGIILEDDCLPDPSFFSYCAELLDRFSEDSSVMVISGSRLVPPENVSNSSYSFTRNFSIWGWATWRRAWDLNDLNMVTWNSSGRQRALGRLNRKGLRLFWDVTFRRARTGLVDTWDHQWLYSCWSNGGIAITPSVNLIRNIGTDASDSFTSPRSWRRVQERNSRAIALPLVHPSVKTIDVALDRWIDNHIYRVRWYLLMRFPRAAYRRIVSRIRKLAHQDPNVHT